MRSFVEKLAKAIKERGVSDNCFTYVDGFQIMIYGRIQGDKILDLINPEDTKGNLKIYDDEYDLLGRVITDCRQRTEDALIEQLNNL